MVRRAERFSALSPMNSLVNVLRRPAFAAGVGFAALVAVGVVAGWALFAPHPQSIPLSAAQQERAAELAAGPFDAGSVRAVAQTEGALAWYATKDDGELRCLVFDVGEESSTGCLPTQQMEEGLTSSLPVSSDDQNGEIVQATLLLSSEDEPLVGFQRQNGRSSDFDSYNEADEERAAKLIEEGYEFGLVAIGSFRGKPVWVGDRVIDKAQWERCLIVDAVGAVSCAPFAPESGAGIRLDVIEDDVESAETIVQARLEVRYTAQQRPYLTITGD